MLDARLVIEQVAHPIARVRASLASRHGCDDGLVIVITAVVLLLLLVAVVALLLACLFCAAVIVIIMLVFVVLRLRLALGALGRRHGWLSVTNVHDEMPHADALALPPSATSSTAAFYTHVCDALEALMHGESASVTSSLVSVAANASSVLFGSFENWHARFGTGAGHRVNW